ncbi:MAG: hypothetical protein K2H38_12800 [Muribaculaceae bacterium]|nr:hypothetical protein [Muribaculaceae bacterium]
MSEVKQAKHGAVTTVGDADLVMCCVNGVYHPISFENLMKAVRGGIQIGGRNLLSMPRDTSNARVSIIDGVVAMIADVDVYFSIPYANRDLMVVGETYTLSFDCEGMRDGNRWTMNGAQGSGIFSIELKNGRCSATFVLNDKQFKEGSTSFGFDDGARVFPNGFAPVRLSRFKLERGNMATDYTPAPEDIASGLWGGVIGLLPITYNLTEKGGAHERGEEACGQAEIGSDGHLSFGTLDSACELIGRVCEDGDDPASGQSCISVESGRDGTLENICVRLSVKHRSGCSRKSEWPTRNMSLYLSDNPESRGRRKDIFPGLHKRSLAKLESRRLADRKGVAV